MTQNLSFINKALATAITLACLNATAAFAIDTVQTDLMASREQQHRQDQNARHAEHIRAKSKLERTSLTKQPKKVTSSRLNRLLL